VRLSEPGRELAGGREILADTGEGKRRFGGRPLRLLL
jgi:hypothetical protein